MLKAPRKNSRLYSVFAVVAGLIFLGFEIRRVSVGDTEAWFWVLVGGLIVVLGMVGAMQRQQTEDDTES